VSSVAATSPKTVRIVAKRRSANFAVRQCQALECSPNQTTARINQVYGRTATAINDALLAVRPEYRRACHSSIPDQKQTGRETQSLSCGVIRKRIHQVAKKRKCSMNQLVNSASSGDYSKTGEGKYKDPGGNKPRDRGYPCESMTRCRSRSVASLIAALGALQECNPVAARCEEPDGDVITNYDGHLKASGERASLTASEPPCATRKLSFDQPRRRVAQKLQQGMTP